MSDASSRSEAVERLPCLWWWDDPVRRSGAAQMAVDELLFLSCLELPVLRAYRWDGPAVSFGFSECLAPVRERFRARHPEFVRRWTGGGVVEHGEDMTYTLFLPKNPEGGWNNSVAVYRNTHRAIGAVLRQAGIPAVVVEDGRQAPGSLCFAAPVRYDVLAGGLKVAGAGQRRNQSGILHQGSLQGPAADPAVVHALAFALARRVLPMPDSLVPAPEAVATLAAERYASPEWTARH